MMLFLRWHCAHSIPPRVLKRCLLLVTWLGCSTACGSLADDLAAEAMAQARQGDIATAVATAAQVPGDIERAAVLAQIRDAGAGAASAGAANLTSAASSGAPGGGAQADFESLIELITTTVSPTSWDDVGGSGSINPFPTGVLVDADGLLRATTRSHDDTRLAQIRSAAVEQPTDDRTAPTDGLRKVSLTRLEMHLQLRLAAGLAPDVEMLALAGLERVSFLLVYPETGDLVMVGPARPWHIDSQGQPVTTATGRPVLRLDDLVVLLRHFRRQPLATFGCAITPSTEGLAAAQQWLASPAREKLAGRPAALFGEVRRQLGAQRIEVFGLPPESRAARVLVEADYHMKLIGLGLTPSVEELPSYLAMIDPHGSEELPALDVLRWWFTLDQGAVAASADRRAFEFVGRLVRLQSENEMLSDRGERIHTGRSEPLNAAFTTRFTEHYQQLAARYPIYADLENAFNLALVASLIEREGLADDCDWHMTGFGDDAWYAPARTRTPATVESVAHHRVIVDRAARRKHTIGAVSGGVWVDTTKWLERKPADAKATVELAKLRSQHAAAPAIGKHDRWWWD